MDQMLLFSEKKDLRYKILNGLDKIKKKYPTFLSWGFCLIYWNKIQVQQRFERNLDKNPSDTTQGSVVYCISCSTHVMSIPFSKNVYTLAGKRGSPATTGAEPRAVVAEQKRERDRVHSYLSRFDVKHILFADAASRYATGIHHFQIHSTSHA